MKYAAVICFLLFAGASHAQLEGVVYDQRKIGVPNLLVTLIDSVTKKVDTTTSDIRGFYFFQNLKPDTYHLQVNAKGFRPVRERVIIGPEDTGSLPGSEDMFKGHRLDIYLKPSQ
jgi:hypothetical protein